MKILFICNQNQHRSKTAEELFKDRFDTASAGLYNEKPVTEQELEEAEYASKEALKNEPQNQALLTMLAQIYQQQLGLIKKGHAPRWQSI